MAFVCILVMQALYSTALLGSRPIISLYAYHTGASEALIGVLVACFAVLPMILSIYLGQWNDKFGARKMHLYGGIGMLLSVLIPTILPYLAVLFVSQLIMGLSHTCILVSLQKTFGNLDGSRDKLIATFSIAGSFGEFVGPSLNGYAYEHYGASASFGISSVVVLAALIIGVIMKKTYWNSGEARSLEQEIHPRVAGSAFGLMKNVNLRNAMLISGLVLYSKDLFVAYFPIYGSQLGMNATQIGMFLSLMAAMQIIVRTMQYHLVKWFGRSNILLVSLGISGIIFILVPFISLPAILAALAMVLGAGLGLGQPLSIVYVMNSSPPGRIGEVLGMRLGINRASQFSAPIIFGSIGALAGLSSIFWLGGSVLILGALATRTKNIKKEV